MFGLIIELRWDFDDKHDQIYSIVDFVRIVNWWDLFDNIESLMHKF